ncbi:MAG: hypothetical protein EOM69_13250, partial [Clostridia bacterium]|nr:hypothetical protein [Clostridia bacterium]
MAQTNVNLSVNPAALLQALRNRWQTALPQVAAQVLNDCNRYARDDTGALIQSSRAASSLATGKLVWNTPYARRVYYTGTPSHTRNAAASLRWCEKAKTLHPSARQTADVSQVSQLSPSQTAENRESPDSSPLNNNNSKVIFYRALRARGETEIAPFATATVATLATVARLWD